MMMRRTRTTMMMTMMTMMILITRSMLVMIFIKKKKYGRTMEESLNYLACFHECLHDDFDHEDESAHPTSTRRSWAALWA